MSNLEIDATVQPFDFELPIIGKKVIIRKLQVDDLDQMYDLESDPCTKRYLDGPVKHSREQWIAGMQRSLDSTSTLAVTTTSGAFAGRASLTRTGSSSDPWEVRAVISTKYRGDHLGREVCQLLIDLAFDQLNVPSVVAIVHRSNERSLKLCASLGFNREGVRDNDHDVFVFSREMPRYWTSEILKCD